MESRGKRDRLEMVCGIADFAARRVGIVSGNGRSILDAGRWIDCLGKMYTGIEIRIGRIAAVAGPEAGVYIELREVRESLADVVRVDARRGTTLQSAKPVEINYVRALRRQIGVNELEMGDLILGVVVDILIHVRIEVL